MATDAGGWYYVDPSTGAPTGPFDVRSLQGLLSSGNLPVETHMWREGQAEWLPLKEIQELKPVVQVAMDLLKKSAKQKNPEDELAEFEAEISALEAQAADDTPNPGDGPSTPDELEFEDDDGTIYVWDNKLRKYMPKDGGVASASADYDIADMIYVEDQEALPSLEEAKKLAARLGEEQGAEHAAEMNGKPLAGHKRPAEGEAARASEPSTSEPAAAAGAKGKKGGKKGKQQAPQDAGWFELKQNTSIYINGLPLDVTVEELHEACSKFGLIKEDEQKKPRIKLYRHPDTGELKGDALVTYLREPSVALAINLLDGARLRPADLKGPIMTVQPAKFELKGGSYVPKAKPGANKKQKKAVLEKQERLLGWGGFDDKAPPEKVTVILHHMFRPAELAMELGGAADLEAEVLAEAKQIGPVEKVRVFKDHPEGVVSIKFKREDHAQACLTKMNGRYFSGQQIAATMWDGLTNYAAVKVKETIEEQEARLEAYARELEARKAAQASGVGAGKQPGVEQPPAAGAGIGDDTDMG